MSELMFAAATGMPLVAGWSVHALRLTRRIEAARRDPLSGLWTRGAFETLAARTLARCPHVAVVLVDLDGFKEVNDDHGHAAGDAAIRSTAASLTDALSESSGAVAARLGGDEFAAVVPLAHPIALPWLLNGLHGEITAPFRHAGRDLGVGASIGAALTSDLTSQARPADALALLLRLADEAMYAAKRTGGGWHYAATISPTAGTTAGRRTGRPGTHTTHRKGAA
ncbi:GGDEF domain-containing protein [Streptomyces sp. uw30]|uniref:GGDEF domain-containing protein n=1 Tax=Streptomyces sp. uw30 TaxID=1828179 RepID=UPI0011CE5C61|nr:GGDEF domain-containing protein [Streptomyces sp. uw30]TXS40174.1 GGDEF domain-containing protein [Streptomyces sp. uw30]